MNRAVPLVCVLALTACQSQRAKLIAGGVSSVASGIATYHIATYDDAEVPVPLTAFAITAGMFGIMALLDGLNQPEVEQRERRTQVIRLPDRKPEAWELTKTAAAAARAGDCDIVFTNNRIVRELDADFHAVVFMRDVAIVRCLAQGDEAS